MRTPTILAAVAAGLGLAAGCSRPPAGQAPAPAVVPLQEVGELLRAAAAGGRPPAKLADLTRYQPVYPNGYDALKTGGVVVAWGAAMRGEGDAEAGGGEVVAYEKDAPAAGGYVLLTSGEVRKMTAAEFAAAPKAGKK